MSKMLVSNMYQQKICIIIFNSIYICYFKDDYVQHVKDAYVQRTWNDYDYVQHISTKTLYAISTYLNMGYVKDAYVWHVSMKMIMSNKHLLCPICQRCLCPICINKNFVYHCHLPNGLCPRWLCPTCQRCLCLTCINKKLLHCYLSIFVMLKMIMSNMS